MVDPENWVQWKIISVDRKISPLIPEKHFRFYFTFKSLPERRAKGERERERRRAKGERERERTTWSSQHRVWSSQHWVWSSQYRADRDLAFASIAIAAPHGTVNLSLSWSSSPFWIGSDHRSTAPRDLAPRSHPSTSPVNLEPRSRIRLRRDCTKTAPIAPIALRLQLRNGWVLINLTGFDEFFLVGFCFCVYLLRNGIIYLFGSWENVRKKKKMCFLYYF